MARRVTAIKQIKGSQDNVLVLDAGNTLTGQDLADATRGKAVVEWMNMMGYDAMAVGERELFLEVDELVALAKEAKFAMLSANLVRKDTGEPLLAPYTLLDVGGLKVGILGLTNPSADQVTVADRALSTMSASVKEQLEILDPYETAKRYMPELTPYADVIIVVSHLGTTDNVRLAKEVPGITAIVSGGTRQVLSQPMTESGAYVMEAGFDGEWLGRTDFQLGTAGEVITQTTEIIALTPEYADDVDMTRFITQQQAAVGQ